MSQACQGSLEGHIFEQSLSFTPYMGPQTIIQETEMLIKSLEEALQINKKFLLLQMLKNMEQEQKQISLFPEIPRVKLESIEDSPVKKFDERKKNSERVVVQKLRSNNIKNDTKNIPKNFGTAICIYIKKNPHMIKKILSQRKISYTAFLQFNKTIKQKLNSLIDLRKIWSSCPKDPDHEMKTCFRIISFKFMRKHCLHYIFDSRIKNIGSHIRYRRKVLDGMQKPAELTNLKDY